MSTCHVWDGRADGRVRTTVARVVDEHLPYLGRNDGRMDEDDADAAAADDDDDERRRRRRRQPTVNDVMTYNGDARWSSSRD